MVRLPSLGFAALVLGVLAAPMSAQAGLIGGYADFREALDLPSFNTEGPRVLQSLSRIINSSAELTESDETSNPATWGDSLTVDLGDLQLRLTPTDSNTYQTLQVTISNIVTISGEIITGFTQTVFGAIGGNSDPYAITTSFTANSLTVNYLVNNIPGGNSFELASSGFDAFSVTTGAATEVPEPASFLLVGAGLVGMARLRRRTA